MSIEFFQKMLKGEIQMGACVCGHPDYDGKGTPIHANGTGGCTVKIEDLKGRAPSTARIEASECPCPQFDRVTMCPLLSNSTAVGRQGSGLAPNAQASVEINPVLLPMPCQREVCELWLPFGGGSGRGTCSLTKIGYDLHTVGTVADKLKFGHGV